MNTMSDDEVRTTKEHQLNDMDFDFEALLCKCMKKCTEATGQTTDCQSQFVAAGVWKRLHAKILNRRISRMSLYDSKRNLPKTQIVKVCQSRNQLLEKWKADKEQKRAAASLKKVFRTGNEPTPLSFVPLPQSPIPSTSGRVAQTPGPVPQTLRRVLRSSGRVPQSLSRSPARNTTNATTTAQSFAPINAEFKPPQIKNMVKLSTSAPPKLKNMTVFLNFEPGPSKQPRSKPTTREAGTQTICLSMPTTREAGTQIIQPCSTKGKPQIHTLGVSGIMKQTTLITDIDILRRHIDIIQSVLRSSHTPKGQVINDESSSEEKKPLENAGSKNSLSVHSSP